MLVQNKNLPNAELALPGTNGLVATSNAEGVFDVPEALGAALIQTPHWAEYKAPVAHGVGVRPAGVARAAYVPGSSEIDGDASAQDRQRKVGKLQRYRANPTAPTAVAAGKPAGRTLPSIERALDRMARGEAVVPPPPPPPPAEKPPEPTLAKSTDGDPLAATRARLAASPTAPRLGVALADGEDDDAVHPAVVEAEDEEDEPPPDLAKIRSREGLLEVAADYGITLTEEQRTGKVVELRDAIHVALYGQPGEPATGDQA